MDTLKLKKIVKAFVDFLETILLAITISGILYLTVLIPNQVDGESMEPNFFHNDLILTNKVIQWFGATNLGQGLDYDYQRGDVIIFQHKKTDLIKRIVAKENDVVRIQNNKLYINEKLLDEKYIPTSARTQITSGENKLIKEGENITVPPDHYFVLGDSRENSKDSRFLEIGFVSRDQIKGRVFIRYWPLSRFGLIKKGEFNEIEQ